MGGTALGDSSKSLRAPHPAPINQFDQEPSYRPRINCSCSDAVRECLETFVQFPRFYGLGYVADSAPVALVFGWSERWIHGWHFHLKEMCVSTPLQRQGLGRILLTELESRLVSRGVQRIFLESGESLPARRFYEVLGYRPLSLVSLAKSIEA